MKRNYDDEQYRVFRVTVLRRDKHKCKWPGCKRLSKLKVHHIIRWASNRGLRYNPSNGITLCNFHHNMVTGREEQFAVFLYGLISNV